MARWEGAIWQPVAQASGTLRPIAVCLHHQAGSGNPAPVYASRGVSAHFWLPRAGTPVQHVDTGVRAWHGGGTLNDTAIGVETEGCGSPPHADPLTEHQLNTFAALYAWASRVHGIPLVLSEHATQPGFNYHRVPGGFNTACPCDVRKNARAEILRRASGGAPPPPPRVEEGNMIAQCKGGYWTAARDGAVYAFGSAAFRGNAMGHVTGAIVGIAGEEDGSGYRLLASDGGVFCFGVPFLGRPDRV